MGTMASQITSIPIVCSAENTKAPRYYPLSPMDSPMDSPQKGPVTRKMFPSDDVFIINKTNSKPEYNGRWFADDIFTYILVNEN